jgi:phage tail protein X
MAETKTPRQEGSRKKTIFFKVNIGEKFTEYKAVYKDLELWGKTVGSKENIKGIVRRIISADNGVPDGVTMAARGLAIYIASMASINASSRVVMGAVEVPYGLDGRLKLGASLYYITDYNKGESGWRGEVEAVYHGNDGLIDNAIHKVIRNVDFGPDVDVVALYRMLLAVARHAINASSH